MKIEKVLNNNVVVALDENGAETVLMGRGLGFGRRAGDEAPPDKVEKRFTLHSDQLFDRFQQLITSIPLPHFLMSERIINHAKIALGKELSDSIYVTLPDHISAAVNRYKEGIVLPNPLLWDIRQLYKDEFRVGSRRMRSSRRRPVWSSRMMRQRLSRCTLSMHSSAVKSAIFTI